MINLNLAPALRLLAHWAPTRATAVVRGHMPQADGRTWAEPPEPAVFASLVPERFPLAVEVLNHREDPVDEFADARPRPEVTAEVHALLLAAHPDELCEPARELLGQLAFEFAEFGELARLTVAAEPGGPALDELHLVALGDNDQALVLSSAATDTGEGGTPVFSRDTPATPGHDPVAVLADVAEVLGEYVWLSNNDRLRVGVSAEGHGVDASTGAAFREWWPTSATSADLRGELWDEEPPLELLDAEALAAFVASFTAANLDSARSGAWAAELIDDYDIDDDPQPRFPGDRLVELFTAELFARAAALAGAPGVVHGIGLPADEEDAVYGIMAAVVFAGPTRIVTLAIDAGT